MPSTATDKIRSFIAIALPPELLKTLRTLQWEARHAGVKARWVNPGQIHCTLKFLGDSAAKGLEKVAAILERHCAARAPFELTCQGLGVFPDLERPRVLWAGLEASATIFAELQQAIEEATAAIGYKSDGRPFHPHLTIGRMEAGRGGAALTPFLQAFGRRRFGAFPVTHIELIKSELTPKGPIYTQLQSFSLGGKSGE